MYAYVVYECITSWLIAALRITRLQLYTKQFIVMKQAAFQNGHND